MKLKVLMDNNTYIDQYYLAEPAVSYYIELDDRRILFDTGYSDAIRKNIDSMHIDLTKLTDIILSHGHNDHTNGLKYLLDSKKLNPIRLIAHPDCFQAKYEGEEYIGAPFTKDEISIFFQYEPSKTVMEIAKNLLFLGEIPRLNTYEATVPIGFCLRNGQKQADFVLDDSALVYKKPDGIFIITGCSHSGICNIIEYAKQVCKEKHILGILGGFHLLEDDEQLQKTLAYLKSNEIDRIYPCHCVSLSAKARMMAVLPTEEVAVGMSLEL